MKECWINVFDGGELGLPWDDRETAKKGEANAWIYRKPVAYRLHVIMKPEQERMLRTK